jgi:hypothetical protein
MLSFFFHLVNLFHAPADQFHKDVFQRWLVLGQFHDLDIGLREKIDDACQRCLLH